MNNKLISVIIPTYQHAKTLSGCIDAILKQDYQPIEIIIVNDGSTDDTCEVLKKYEGKVNVINQQNLGANFARNRGLSEANGEYIIFCDADVIMRSDMLSQMHDALITDTGASFAYCKFKFGWKTFYPIEFDKQKLKERNYIHTTSLVRKKDFPGFDIGVKRLQDWDVWLTMLENEKRGILIDKTLFKVKIYGTSRIGSSWLPSFVFKISWPIFGWTPKSIVKYNLAHEEIRKKHKL